MRSTARPSRTASSCQCFTDQSTHAIARKPRLGIRRHTKPRSHGTYSWPSYTSDPVSRERPVETNSSSTSRAPTAFQSTAGSVSSSPARSGPPEIGPSGPSVNRQTTSTETTNTATSEARIVIPRTNHLRVD